MSEKYPELPTIPEEVWQTLEAYQRALETISGAQCDASRQAALTAGKGGKRGFSN